MSPLDVSGIPDIALSIPDFEGQAVLRIFSNATKSEIGCYSSVITNGATFAHPIAIGLTVGLFVVAALCSSFLTSLYGNSRAALRTQHAHSVSMLIVFAVLHHVYFTGALSLDWPSVLVAFRSNFAWSGGMIYSKSIQNSINHLIAENQGNSSIAGAGRSHPTTDDSIGGGFDLSTIYGHKLRRALANAIPRIISKTEPATRTILERRDAVSGLRARSTATTWYGSPVALGLPLPGNFSGFAGTLSKQGIPASNALLTGFLWLLVLLVSITAVITSLRIIAETVARRNFINNEKLTHFRSHWLRYTREAVSHTFVVGFFAATFLFFFQFAIADDRSASSSPAVVGVASFAFVVMLLGMVMTVVSTFWSRFQPKK